MARKSRKSAATQPRTNQSLISLVGLLVMGAAALWGCGEDLGLPTPSGERLPGAYGDTGQCLDEWRSGVPQVSGAETRVLCRQEYVAVYDPAAHVPRVVGEYLTPAEFDGDVERQDNFAPDPDLPGGESAELSDYRGSGYDRGHMAPAADFKSSPQAMAESFYLSNMVPQVHAMNTGIWAALESAVRDCAEREGRVFVLTGPVLKPGAERIGRSGVVVPGELFKVVVSGRSTRAFVIPNQSQRSDTNFDRYEVTADEVQQQAGVTLFPGGGVDTGSQGRFCAGSFGG